MGLRGRELYWLVLLWLGGLSLRITVLAVPPLLPRIHDALALDEKEVGVLTTLPVLLLAAAAVLGALVIRRFGARRALLAGLLIIAFAGAARGVGPSTGVLFGMTFLMGCGIAVCQPALPALVADWFPARVGLATAVYSNGLLVAEALAAGLTLPLILPLVGGHWALALAFWSLVALCSGLLMATAGGHMTEPVQSQGQWWPDWQDPQTWRLGLLLGMGQIPYWVPNAFLGDFLQASGRPDLVGASLTALNLAQLPAGLLIAAWPRGLVQKRWPMIADGAIILAATVALLLTPPWLTPVWAAVLGFTAGIHFILNLALAPLIARKGDAGRLSAGIFSISYSCAFLAPLAGGALWDATGSRVSGFLPVLVAAAAVVLLAATVDLTRGSSRPVPPLQPA